MSLSRSGSVAVALAVALTGCVGAGSQDASPASGLAALSVAPKDSFSGTASHATGRFAGDQGQVKIALQPGAGSTVRTLTIVIMGSSCAAKQRCLALSGTLRGKLVAQHVTIPDIGRTFSISAYGHVKPLSRVSATGSVHGLGNIRYGHETLQLTAQGPKGSVMISATSPQVPGFTSP